LLLSTLQTEKAQNSTSSGLLNGKAICGNDAIIESALLPEEENVSNYGSSIKSTKATPSTSPFAVASIQQYRNTEVMRANSIDILRREISIEDSDTDESARKSDIHTRDMVC